MATKNRVTVKLKNPNPLFVKWITEWRDKAIEKDSKMQYTFTNALQSLKKYPLPLESGRDCKILKGFGEKLCTMLDNKLTEHKQNMLVENNVNDNVQNKSQIKKRISTSREYLPAYRSGAYAILVSLYRKSLDSQYSGYMLKADIIKEGRHLCDKSFIKPDPGSYYTAWSSMKTLLGKKLVIKQSTPAKYSLSNDGVVLGQKLFNMEKGEVEVIPNLQSTSNQENLLSAVEIDLKDDDNLDTVPSNSQSQDETFIFAPYSFKIILLVDTQEVSGSKNNDNPLLAELTHLNVQFEVKHLKVGDYTWICRQTVSNQELILPYIIERKRMDDLASSITDGRFHEQKFRLRQCGIENVIYLVESYGSNSHVGLPISNLYQAITNTLIQDNFDLKFTADLRGTVKYLSILTSVLQDLYKNKTLVSCPKQNLNKTDIKDDLVPLMTFTEFNKNASKFHNFKVRELFIRQLLQLKRMTVEKALAIVENYPTPKVLYMEYQNTSGTVGENLLSNLQYGNLNKKIGPLISKAIYQLFTSTY
ncbi:hypothetical protein RN001_005897 [Aquatica leii]|uniref:Crossover junction endonuclease MUS81 n=1 Tax=Aquatica leii TaxID=1421715 RepID=A0AAN7PDC0_9COLE|nr:hypothetical protein RN001_005897 [Aquatica leii]